MDEKTEIDGEELNREGTPEKENSLVLVIISWVWTAINLKILAGIAGIICFDTAAHRMFNQVDRMKIKINPNVIILGLLIAIIALMVILKEILYKKVRYRLMWNTVAFVAFMPIYVWLYYWMLSGILTRIS